MRSPVPGAAVLTERLKELSDAGELDYHGPYDRDRHLYAVTVPVGGERIFHVTDMIRWLTGWTVAREAHRVGFDDTGREVLQNVRRVLVNPSMEDQHRIAIRVAMEDRGVGVADVAQMQGVTRKHVSDSLRFLGAGLLSVMASLGHNTIADPWLAKSDPDAPVDLTVDRREPFRLADLRVLAYCHEQGVLDLVGPKTPIRQVPVLDPTTLMVAPRYQLGLHLAEAKIAVHTVQATAARAWVMGVADRIAPSIGTRIYQLRPTKLDVDDM